MYTLFARPGWGSAIVELQLAWYGLPYAVEDVGNPFTSAEARARLAPMNGITQLPTLLLPDGAVMTESAAITLHLADLGIGRSLVPGVGEAARPGFLRWLVFLVANIYPTFTYADDPARFVDEAAAQAGFKARVDAYAQRLWGMMEDAAGGPWFCGAGFSAIDLYIGVMTQWRPKRPWFAAHCPRLHGIAEAAEAVPELRAVWQRNIVLP
ncbi:MAG: glutathione S-transferase [Acetobacteraceae bacterium]|nr:glutathione S-transferase [Acetobacteraceae bacterium]